MLVLDARRSSLRATQHAMTRARVYSGRHAGNGASRAARRTEPRTPHVLAVRHAIEMLRCLASDTPLLGVSEIASVVGMHKSSVSRMVATLEEDGLVERDPASKRIRLGAGLLAWPRRCSQPYASSRPRSRSSSSSRSAAARRSVSASGTGPAQSISRRCSAARQSSTMPRREAATPRTPAHRASFCSPSPRPTLPIAYCAGSFGASPRAHLHAQCARCGNRHHPAPGLRRQRRRAFARRRWPRSGDPQ